MPKGSDRGVDGIGGEVAVNVQRVFGYIMIVLGLLMCWSTVPLAILHNRTWWAFLVASVPFTVIGILWLAESHDYD